MGFNNYVITVCVSFILFDERRKKIVITLVKKSSKAFNPENPRLYL